MNVVVVITDISTKIMVKGHALWLIIWFMATSRVFNLRLAIKRMKYLQHIETNPET